MDNATIIRFGSIVKGYAAENSDDDLIYFEKLRPAEYRNEFVHGLQRRNKNLPNDVIHSTELIGLRGIVTGRYYYLALFQWQIPNTSRRLKDLVSELSTEYYDRIYNTLRILTMKTKNGVMGKHGLQQLYAWQAAYYIGEHKRCPDFQLKFPECVTVPEYREFYASFLDKRDELLPHALVDRFLQLQPQTMEAVQHEDDVFFKKILDYVLFEDNE